MEKGENFKRKNLPTMQQIQYLLELERMGRRRGTVAMIAEICGVSHGAVSRYFKSCCESGYLTEAYEFTDRGKAWLDGYKTLMDGLDAYLRKIGIPKKEIPENVRDMIEHVDYYTLSSMLRSHQKMRTRYSAEKKEVLSRNFLDEVLEYGNYQVYFTVYRMEAQRKCNVSMANRGFAKPAYLRHNRRVSRLELLICEMTASSRVHGEQMAGHLEALKYEQNGVLHLAEVKEGKIRIPLEACRFHRRRGGEVQGIIPVTATCSVGRTHMPESTALLIFWL